ncbi:SDR family oxidoreductase [Acidisoma cellulosilytica]|uniref:SDR family oxidoreductase n=1 Tax=Acidisoma cellulosilyticum TaxID=2802395 RepID=A0A963Z215_9PROT|nr:SDR family oxidoreductase [Acidisoma cellulosilyticum]MCB8881066.1 SDR family oxidoreductase [Acidisoma cellulosilyticum]
MSLSNKVILVSGANRGIGAATVRELLKGDVKKIYAGARTLASLPNFGDPRVLPLQLDVTSDTSVLAAAEQARDVDVLLNNAGTMAFGDWLTSPQDVIDADMNTNFYGTLRVIRAFAPSFVSRGSGTIANVVSIVGLAPVSVLAGYSASKAALQSMTQALRATLQKSGITVIGIYPGPIDTDLAKGIPLDKATPEHAAANIVKGIAEGQTYIFPDPTALQIGHLWAHDGRQLEIAIQVGG